MVNIPIPDGNIVVHISSYSMHHKRYHDGYNTFDETGS